MSGRSAGRSGTPRKAPDPANLPDASNLANLLNLSQSSNSAEPAKTRQGAATQIPPDPSETPTLQDPGESPNPPPPPARGPLGPIVRLIGRLWRVLFRDQWDAIDAEAARERALLGGRWDPRPLWVLIVVALVMVFQEYWGDRPTAARLLPQYAEHARWGSLFEFAWWSGAKVVGYLVVPAILVLVTGMRLRDCGAQIRGTGRHLWIYVVLYLAILPVVVIASRTEAFQHTYPFYKLAPRSWTDLVAWEAMYAASFLALEFFFRGFMLFTLRRAFGSTAIFVMIVPYCMIHFHKPVAEVTGAIFAGIILGTLALRTRSIWCGVLIHVSVALSMDLLSMWRTTGFPGSGRFVGGM